MGLRSVEIISLFASFTTTVLGHSWLHCSDYGADITGQDYDDANCNGYIRDWSTKWGAPSFAADLGINYFASDGAWCQPDGRSSPIEDMYSDTYPAADWYVGNTYRLVWPAKNHANYDCFNNIPDSSMKLYYMPTPDATSDGSSLSSDWAVLHDFQSGCTAGVDGCGFQKCPKFCENTDGAPCYGDYTVDSSKFSSDGYYTIMWYWIFNSGSAPYTTCFEVYVHTSGTDGGGVGTESVSESEDSDEEHDYLVQIPIRYTGATYNEETLIDAANGHFNNDDGISFSVVSESTGTNGFNATIQTNTDDSIYVSDEARDDQAICTSIQNAFVTGTCTVNEGEIRSYYSGSTGDSGSSSDGYASVVTSWSIAFTVVILLLINKT